jgi:hypothetical protein
MSSWAEIDKANKVIRVLVGDNNDPNGDEGYQWLLDNLGGTWIKTSYNGNIRYNFAGIGFTYDPIDDAFIAPVPCDHAELLLNAMKRWECASCEAASMQSSNSTS